jgi:hypothetical protein
MQETVLAAGDPLRFKHEVVHDQLTSFFKEVVESREAFWPVKCVLLLDSHHGKIEPSFSEPIALMVEGFFPGEKFLARRQPFFSCHNVRKVHFLLLSSPLAFSRDRWRRVSPADYVS